MEVLLFLILIVLVLIALRLGTIAQPAGLPQSTKS
jgi:hypothetical protein